MEWVQRGPRPWAWLLLWKEPLLSKEDVPREEGTLSTACSYDCLSAHTAFPSPQETLDSGGPIRLPKRSGLPGPGRSPSLWDRPRRLLHRHRRAHLKSVLSSLAGAQAPFPAAISRPLPQPALCLSAQSRLLTGGWHRPLPPQAAAFLVFGLHLPGSFQSP